jgi:hypothetical protein
MLRGAVIKSLATSQVTQHSRPIGYSPAQDRAIDVGADALDNVGGGIEEPLKPDPVEDSGVTRRTSTSICRTGGGPSGSGCVGSGAMISRYFVGPSASRLLCVP